MMTSLTAMLAVTRRSAPRLWRLHDQLAEIADPRDLRGWILTSLAALGDSLPARPMPYLISDATPRQDTFMAREAPPPADRASALVEGVLTAYAARRAVRALDGELPEQPLATTLDRRGPARTVPSELRHAAFLLDGQAWIAELGPDVEASATSGTAPAAERQQLLALVHALARPSAAPSLLRLGAATPIPFVTVCLDDEQPAYLRHTHRQGWSGERGPWLGLGRAGSLRAVSTSHFVVDGYGHAWLVATLAALEAELAVRHRAALLASLGSRPQSDDVMPLLGPPPGPAPRVPGLPPPLGLAYRALPAPSPRVTPLAYRFGQLLAQRIGGPRPPTVFIPIAPCDRRDPLRLRRRVSAAVVSVHSDERGPEPYEAFAARAARTIAAEACGAGILATMHRAAANLPVPLRWKRELIGSHGGRWLGELPAALGGRGCLSSIRVRERPALPLVAISSPVLLPSALDPIGGCLVTIVDDGERAIIAASGTGIFGDDATTRTLLDELLDD
jgi:hypothetical protein